MLYICKMQALKNTHYRYNIKEGLTPILIVKYLCSHNKGGYVTLHIYSSVREKLQSTYSSYQHGLLLLWELSCYYCWLCMSAQSGHLFFLIHELAIHFVHVKQSLTMPLLNYYWSSTRCFETTSHVAVVCLQENKCICKNTSWHMESNQLKCQSQELNQRSCYKKLINIHYS